MVVEVRRGRRRDRTEVPMVTKYILFFWNFACELAGLAMAAVGAYILISTEKKVKDAIDFFLDPSCIVCLAGSVTTFIAFFGCMGSLRENTVFLKIFYYFLTLMLLGQIVLAVLTFIFYYAPDVRQQMKLFPEDDFKAAILKYRDESREDMQNLIDNFQEFDYDDPSAKIAWKWVPFQSDLCATTVVSQSKLGCCGVSNDDMGYKDWNANRYFNCTPSNPSPERCSVPPSCCKLEPGQTINLLCGGNVQQLEKGTDILIEGDTSKIYTKGCLKALGDWINEHSLVIGGVMLGILLPQIFLICMARNLMDGVKTQKSKWRRNERA